MITKEKAPPGLKSKIAAKASELVNDLNTVRATVLSKERQLSPAEYARLEPRLFESWVIEKLAENECLLLAISQQLAEIKEEFKALRKSLPSPEKKSRKDR